MKSRQNKPWILLLLPVLLILVACGPSGPWEEPFDEAGAWNLTTDATAETTVEDEQLYIHVFVPGQIAWTSFERPFDDFDLEVEATQVSGPVDNEYGILVRMEEDLRFYAFSVSGDGYVRAAYYDEGSWTVLGSDWTASAAVNQGAATNLLEVRAEGSELTFSVNGEEVVQIEDAKLRSGDVGLYAGAFSEGDVVVAFDNLKVIPLK